ncbi:hypothetical protein RJ640_017726, partial [Escallonia rubra]
MAGIFKQTGSFAVTPHKVSICILLQVYAPPPQISVPFSSVSQHNRLGLFLLALTKACTEIGFLKACDDILEPTLDELITQLGSIGGLPHDWLSDHLTRRLSSLSSPDELFNFFSDLRGILGGPDTSALDDDQIVLDPNSNLGFYLRRCLLAFNTLSFEGVCHLLTNIGTHCKEAYSSRPPYESSCSDDSNAGSEALLGYENMDLEDFVFEKVTEEMESRKRSKERVSFHNYAPKALSRLVEATARRQMGQSLVLWTFDAEFFPRKNEGEICGDQAETDIDVSGGPKLKQFGKHRESSLFANLPNDSLRGSDASGGVFLRTDWQIHGYSLEQADVVEKHASSFPLNAFESILKQLQKLAPELHTVHFLRYLNSLYHDNYSAALENLHRYFDYSSGRYEIALLCLGMMHFHFGHPKQALEVLTEAVQVSQQHSDDNCLAYTLTAISNLLSEIGALNATGILRSSYSPFSSIGTSLSVQQQLFILLTRSLKRAESLKLKRLVASNHLAIAKFDLTHVQRPLLSFGPKASMKLRTLPPNVCKELRLCSHLITEFGTESSIMTTEGALSTSWLKNLKKPRGSLVLSQENVSGSDTFYFCAQQSSIPGSVQQLLGSSYLVRATSWEMYGSAPLARINVLAFATCFADTSSSADLALAYAKLIQHLALSKGYKEAFAALKIAEEKFLSVSKSRIQLVKLQLLHQRAFHRGHLKLAQQLCDELGTLASCATGVDMELKTEASIRHARTLLAANQFSQAALVAHSLFCMCYKFNLQVENATVLLLFAEIHKRSGNAVLGIPYALASLSFCQSFNLDLLKASATLTLAELWLSLGSSHAKRALYLLHGAFPMIFGHGGLELRARANIAEAKCYLSDPSFSDSEVVLEPLRQASEELEVLE